MVAIREMNDLSLKDQTGSAGSDLRVVRQSGLTPESESLLKEWGLRLARLAQSARAEDLSSGDKFEHYLQREHTADYSDYMGIVSQIRLGGQSLDLNKIFLLMAEKEMKRRKTQSERERQLPQTAAQQARERMLSVAARAQADIDARARTVAAIQERATQEAQAMRNMPANLPELPDIEPEQEVVAESDLPIPLDLQEMPDEEYGEANEFDYDNGDEDQSLTETGSELTDFAEAAPSTVETVIPAPRQKRRRLAWLRRALAERQTVGGVKTKQLSRGQLESVLPWRPGEVKHWQNEIRSFRQGDLLCLAGYAVVADGKTTLQAEQLVVPDSQLAADLLAVPNEGLTVVTDVKNDAHWYRLAGGHTARFLSPAQDERWLAAQYQPMTESLFVFNLYGRGLVQTPTVESSATLLSTGRNEYQQQMEPLLERLSLVNTPEWQTDIRQCQSVLNTTQVTQAEYSEQLLAGLADMAGELVNLGKIVDQSLALHIYAVTEEFVAFLSANGLTLAATDQAFLDQHVALQVALTELSAAWQTIGKSKDRDLVTDLEQIITTSQQVTDLLKQQQQLVNAAEEQHYALIQEINQERFNYYKRELGIESEEEGDEELEKIFLSLETTVHDLYRELMDELAEFGQKPSADAVFDWLTDWLQARSAQATVMAENQPDDLLEQLETHEVTSSYTGVMRKLLMLLPGMTSGQQRMVSNLLASYAEEVYSAVQTIASYRPEQYGRSPAKSVADTAAILNTGLDRHLRRMVVDSVADWRE